MLSWEGAIVGIKVRVSCGLLLGPSLVVCYCTPVYAVQRTPYQSAPLCASMFAVTRSGPTGVEPSFYPRRTTDRCAIVTLLRT